jgi:hypothetical protein
MKKIALIIISLHLISSCSLHYHLEKAMKKGYRCDEVSDTIQITSVDSVPVIVHDSIVWEKFFVTKDTIVKYKTTYIPKTRWQTKIEYKLKRDTIRQIERIEVAKHKSQKKGNGNIGNLWLLFFIGFAVSTVIHYLFKFSKFNL